jgi:LysM repeat protein
MKLRFLSCLVLFFLSVSLYAQTDTTEQIFKSLENMEIEFVLDSIYNSDSLSSVSPAFELYKNNWDNTNIRYPSSIFAHKNDTIVFTLVSYGESPYFHPNKGKVISKYGPRHGRMHTGTDVKLPLGDSVFCAFDGKVRLAKRLSGYGNLVLVRHYNGLETIYAHLKSISVKVNDTIKAGDLVGLGGRTGRATTEHLHFETRIFGDPFDSNKYIDFEKHTLRSNTLYLCNKKVFIQTDSKDETPSTPEKAIAQNDSLKSKKAGAVSSNPKVPETNNGTITHVIGPGDNLWSIAKKYNTSIKGICDLNKITTNQVLKIGTVLYISR